MSVVWPVTLPPALRIGFKATMPKVVIRTDMDAGPAKIRRRTSTNPWPIDGELLMTGAQLADFIDFFMNSLEGGALAFQWTNPWTGNPVDFRFREPPDVSSLAPRDGAAGEHYLVPLRVELLPWTEQLVPPPPPPPPAPPGGGDYQFNNGGAGGTAWNQEPDPLEPVFIDDGGGHVDAGGSGPTFEAGSPVTIGTP